MGALKNKPTGETQPREVKGGLNVEEKTHSLCQRSMNVSNVDFVPCFHPALASDPALLLELKTRRPPSLLDLAGCETWSVDFSPDGAWFAWSMGHGIVWVVAWPLDSE